MNRNKSCFYFPADELENLKRRMLHWANQCDILLFLDSNEYQQTYGTYECICGVDLLKNEAAFTNLKELANSFNNNKDWFFGHIGYDYKNKLEKLESNHPVSIPFSDLSFFRPRVVCYILRGENSLWIETFEGEDPAKIWDEINGFTVKIPETKQENVKFEKRIWREEYLEIIRKLKDHIDEGDCYEINFCNEAFCQNVIIDPLHCFEKLNTASGAPFAAYYKLGILHLMCASPERFLQKEKQRIIAQPIKGTAKRSTEEAEDIRLKNELKSSKKERAENVMIVDLMRNDLARFCELGSVVVEELFGLYTFPHVHQMISTISGLLKTDLSIFDAVLLSFPAGSMTGAPKIMVMQLIEQYERARRGLFSGNVGYISPDGNFDFNVVIRSLFYDDQSKYLSYQTGGAITSGSDPAAEWEETLLKASALENIFK